MVNRSASDELASRLSAPPVFVVGAERSGTTWVFDLLRNHPLVAGVFESKLFKPGRGVAGLLHPEVWETEGLSTLISRADAVELTRDVTAGLLLRAVEPPMQYLAEKTPSHVLSMLEIAEVFPDARFVHVVRDGRDVCVSRRAARRTWASDWKREPRGREVTRTARTWRRDVVAGRQSTARLGTSVLEIRYESLWADPIGQTRSLFNFVGLPIAAGEVERAVTATDFVASGRAADRTGFYRGARVGDWRSSFNVFDGLAFNAAAGDALIELGYETDRRWLAPLRRNRPIATVD